LSLYTILLNCRYTSVLTSSAYFFTGKIFNLTHI